ncbi:MAG: hypothetical protein WBF55_16755, partial [Syntrophobacteria bacterium]
NEALKGHHVIHEYLELNLYVIFIVIDFGDIGRAFRTGEVDPVCLRWSAQKAERDKERYDQTSCSFHWIYNGDNKLRGKRTSTFPVSLVALLASNCGSTMGA